MLVGEGDAVLICGHASLFEIWEQGTEGGERMSHEDIWVKNNHKVPEVEVTPARSSRNEAREL